MERKVVIVDGTDRLSTKVTVEKLLKRGSRVVVSGANDHVLDSIERDPSLNCSDLTVIRRRTCDKDTAQRIVNAAVEKYGHIHALIFCLPNYPKRDLETVNKDEFYAVWEELVFGPILLIQAATPQLTLTKGSVVLLTSLGSRKPEGIMSIASSARDRLAKLAAKELKPYGIKVNSINSYLCEAYRANSSWMDWLLFGTPLAVKRAMNIADVVEYAAFLIYNSTDHVTGNSLYIDGALTMTCTVSHALPVRIITAANYWTHICMNYVKNLFR